MGARKWGLKATLCNSCTIIRNCAHLWLFGPFVRGIFAPLRAHLDFPTEILQAELSQIVSFKSKLKEREVNLWVSPMKASDAKRNGSSLEQLDRCRAISPIVSLRRNSRAIVLAICHCPDLLLCLFVKNQRKPPQTGRFSNPCLVAPCG